MIKKVTAVITALLLLLPLMPATAAEYAGEPNARSCILIESESGKILYEKNADEALPPASVTKVMTMLLVFEAIASGAIKYEDTVTVSETAASMGGTQIFLEPGEEMSVDELLKSMIVASANDAAVALAEHIAGSEENFVVKMNERAGELGMTNTHFENTNGLDDTTENHVTSARDISIMTREVLKYPKATEYASIWMDTVRNGEFGLTNTNRLIRFYKGATGLKTGSTSKAKFCISATAMRNGMTLICVIMAAPDRDTRNSIASSLLDYGFANYALYSGDGVNHGEVSVLGGKKNSVGTECDGFSVVVEKGRQKDVTSVCELAEKVKAPVVKGEKLGTVTYKLDGVVIGTSDILAAGDVEKTDFFTLFARMMMWMLCSPEKASES